MLKTLAEAIVLVVLVIFVFLQTWRSTLIPTITIPVSLVGAFAFIKLMGFSINTLTLFGIILATGIVVDDAIVVIENIERHIQEYKVTARQAASDAMARSARRGHRDGAGADRGVRAGRVLPGHDRTALRAVLDDDRVRGRALGVQRADADAGALGAAARARRRHGKGRFFTLLRARDHRRHQRATCACCKRGDAARAGRSSLVFVAALGLTYWVYRSVPQAFVPEEDQGYFITQVQAPAGASLEYTGDIARQAEQIIMKDPDVLAMFSVMGFSFSGAASEPGAHVRPAEAVRRAQGGRALAAAVLGRLSGPLFCDPGRDRRRVHAAVDPRSEPLRRIRVPGARPDRHRHQHAGAGDPGGSRRRATNRRSCAACSARSPPTIRSCRSRSTGSARSRSDCRSSEITSAMQIFLGSQYVNDFEFNNRAYRVYVQADQQFRVRSRRR